MAVRDTTTFLFSTPPIGFNPHALPCILSSVTEGWVSKMSGAGQVGGGFEGLIRVGNH